MWLFPILLSLKTTTRCTLFSLKRRGPYQGRWQGQGFIFIWAAASVLILNTGGKRDSQQEGGRNRCWHEQLRRLMVSLSPFPNAPAWGQSCRSCYAGDSKIHSTVSALLQCWLMRPKWQAVLQKQSVFQKNSQAFLSLMISTKAVPINR